MIQNVFFMLGQANSSMFPSCKEKSISSTSGPLFLFLSFFLSFFLSVFLSFFTLSLSLCILRFLCVSLSLYLSVLLPSYFSCLPFFDYIFFWAISHLCPSLSLSPCLRVLRAPSSCQPIHHCSSAPLYLGLLLSPFFFSIRFITLECAHSTLKRRRSMKLRIQRSWGCAEGCAS